MNHNVKIVKLQFGYFDINNGYVGPPVDIPQRETEIARYLDEGYTIVAAGGSGMSPTDTQPLGFFETGFVVLVKRS